MVIGTSSGLIRLFNYTNNRLMISKELPIFTNFSEIYNRESINNEIIHVSNLKISKTFNSITILKYSPNSDMLICGLKNGVIWILHPDSLTSIDQVPFKHSNEAILNVTFSENSQYMAYSDNAMTVAVFKKGKPNFSSGFWIFLGKYHSHYLCIKELLFQPLINASNTPRFFSLGADKNLVEYDLANSGPYPEPGLKIFNSVQIEFNAIPLSIAWYSEIKDMLVVSNSEYKFRIVSSMTKKIYSTFLGPTFGAPVRIIKILSDQIINEKMQSYIIFVTEKEIGLQKLPLDGNPYKQIALIGHHQKIIKICLSNCKKFLFTLGSNDKCVLMWRINLE
ncbi:cilia- and flagella-associated protein 251-like isoform X3 [Leptopilina boulardi]|uniref:cilia- and flagella-associated protein 251-like isoform X3 n=1 Tax=Leptopilina boulardi TaxID=63433 RepID=UPI0021F62032|nr:cilia- and flagella-associated protein 251-like isoform X3 [Leptopilina boulardi]XP_051169817.1 cilia- and flagella-associated protein 251-like isoform X3 [Leptopilina boulardi]XP_051169818.1 cilia- and flagella-associated protein 251-like isoform X3 [Leptopilina boulardi]